MPPIPQGARPQLRRQHKYRKTQEAQRRKWEGAGIRVVSRRTAWRKKEIQEGFPRLCKQYKQKLGEGVETWGDGEK